MLEGGWGPVFCSILLLEKSVSQLSLHSSHNGKLNEKAPGPHVTEARYGLFQSACPDVSISISPVGATLSLSLSLSVCLCLSLCLSVSLSVSVSLCLSLSLSLSIIMVFEYYTELIIIYISPLMKRPCVEIYIAGNNYVSSNCSCELSNYEIHGADGVNWQEGCNHEHLLKTSRGCTVQANFRM